MSNLGDPELEEFIRQRVDAGIAAGLAAHGVRSKPDPRSDPIAAIYAAESRDEVIAAFQAAGGQLSGENE